MVRQFNLISLSAVLALLAGCGNNAGPQAGISGYNLFRYVTTESHRAEERNAFLDTPFQLAEAPNQFTLGERINFWDPRGTQRWGMVGCVHQMPEIPFVSTYNDWCRLSDDVGQPTPFPLVVSFNEHFRENLPYAVVERISRFPVDELEIYFLPQMAPVRRQDLIPMLRAHFWARPGLPMNFPGGVFNRNLPMGLFEADDVDFRAHVPHQIAVNNLARSNVNIHDNTLSPPNAVLDGRAMDLPGRSFWSVLIDEQGHRAAVTLHWLLSADQTQRLAAIIHGLPDNTKNLRGLMAELDRQGEALLPHRRLMGKLRSLTR